MLIAALLSDSCLFYNSTSCQLLDYWRETNIFTAGSVLLLAVMMTLNLAVIAERLELYSAARRQSSRFIRSVQPALKQADLAECLAQTAKAKRSHVATVMADGLRAYNDAGDIDPVEFARRALHRAHFGLERELRENLGTLATIASTAPFVGLMGTVFGILGSCRGYSGSPAGFLAMVAVGLGQSLVPTALALAVAIIAVWTYNYFCSRLEVFDAEMSNTSLELITWLNSRTPGHVATPDDARPILTTLPLAYDFQRLLLMAVGFCELYLVYFTISAALRR